MCKEQTALIRASNSWTAGPNPCKVWLYLTKVSEEGQPVNQLLGHEHPCLTGVCGKWGLAHLVRSYRGATVASSRNTLHRFIFLKWLGNSLRNMTVFSMLTWVSNCSDLNPVRHLWDVWNKQVWRIESQPQDMNLVLTSWCHSTHTTAQTRRSSRVHGFIDQSCWHKGDVLYQEGGLMFNGWNGFHLILPNKPDQPKPKSS